MPKHFATLDGIKRAATKLKRASGVSHNAALEQVARDAGFADYHAATIRFATPKTPRQRRQYPVTIYEFWSDRERGERGNESRTFMIDKPLSDLVKPHQLSGYLGGCSLASGNEIIGYGRSHSLEQARFEICRIARTLQFMAATGLKPSRGGRCYPKGSWDNRPPGADHDQGWYHPKTRSFVLSEEPYPGRFTSNAENRRAWAKRHGRKTVRIRWGGIYGHGTEFYLTGQVKGGVNVSALARRLAALAPAYTEADWPGADLPNTGTRPQPIVAPPASAHEAALAPVEYIEMSPELAAALKHQRDLDIAEAGPQAPEPSIDHRGVRVESRYSIAHELETMSAAVDAMPDLVRARLESIWCDSKACAFYTVEVKPGRWIEGIEHLIRDAVRAVTDGFNGLIVRDGEHEVWFDPEWEGDDYDCSAEA
ncbi:hypothetical protein ACFQ1E_19260 [Sphingomonas canadensis]|uniref:Uncharacterized protein n=2 Tax=Sphingomonas canadensis TaxID=1219257 RepID=A0ABW3HFL1_9SPHN|nr:hypothetical protein [Sphingomonas canadensis]